MIPMSNYKKQLSFILRFSLNDFKSKFSGSVFGAIWAVAEPLITVLIYRFVYTIAFGQNEVDGIPYYLWLSVGIALWFFVSEGLRSVCSVYRDYSYLIKKININKKALPVARALSSLYSHILFMVIVIAICLINHTYIKNVAALLIITVICFTFVILLGKILALLCGYIKDVSNIIGVVLNISFWITPIFWNINPLPHNLKMLINLNPVALIVEGYRNAFFYGGLLSLNKLYYLFAIFTVLYLISHVSERKLLSCIADKI